MFNEFWALYPRKVAKSMALKAWGRLTEKDRSEAILALPRHAQEWADTEARYIPHASTWINGRRWEDEIEEKKTFEQIAKERWEQRKKVC